MLSHREIVELALRAAQRRRRLVPVPAPVLRPVLRAYEALAGPTAIATWDEAEMLGVTMRTPRGTADAEALGVQPRALAAVLGALLVGGRLGPDRGDRARGLELRGDLQQRVLAQRLADELGVGRQPVLAEAGRDRDRPAAR